MSDNHDHDLEVKYNEQDKLLYTKDKEVSDKFATFINAAEEMLGRKLNTTTGGGSKNHLEWNSFLEDAKKYYGVTQEQIRKGSKKSKSGNVINQALINRAAKMMSKAAQREYTRGALDIGMTDNSLTDEEALKLGKLALKHGLRVGEEDNHLHLDSRQNTNPGAERIFHHNRRSSDTQRAQSIARETALKQFLKDEEQANIDFNVEGQKLQQEEFNRKANEANEKEKVIPQSPLATLRQSMQPKEAEKEEVKRESLKKMSIAKDIDFGIYS